MKKRILTIPLLLLFPFHGFSQAPLPPILEFESGVVYLRWDPNPEPELVGYVLSWGTNSALVPFVFTNAGGATVTNMTYEGTNYLWSAEGTNTVQQVRGLTPGVTYYFAVRAKDSDGLISQYSDEVAYTPQESMPPTRPKGIKIGTVPVYRINVMFSDDPHEWSEKRSFSFVVESPRAWQFFSAEARIESLDSVVIPPVP